MKKTSKKPLLLTRETIRALDGDRLGGIAGATNLACLGPSNYTCNCGGTTQQGPMTGCTGEQ